jgi:hypothetical protein
MKGYGNNNELGTCGKERRKARPRRSWHEGVDIIEN